MTNGKGLQETKHNGFTSIVTTKRGNIPLEQVKKGDLVLGYSFSKRAHEYYEVKSVDIFDIKQNKVWIVVNGEHAFAPHQSIYANNRLIHAQQLKLGDKLRTITDGEVVVKSLRHQKDRLPKIKLIIERPRSIFNFLKKDDCQHNFYINGLLVHNANRFWVGGTGTWDASTTTNWSASSGGASGASAPTTSDAVTFNGSSGAGTCTLSGLPACASLDASASSVLTFTGTGTLTCAGSFTLKAGLTVSGWTGTVTFSGTGTLTYAGLTMAHSVIVDATGATVTLGDALNIGTSQLSFKNGTFNTNGKTVTCGTFDSYYSNTRTLTLGASTINCSPWNIIGTNLTLNANTSTINAKGSFYGGAKTYNIVSINGNGTYYYLGDANTFATLTYTGTASTRNEWRIRANQTITGTLTITGNSLVNRAWVWTGFGSQSTQYTLTAAAVSLTNVDFQDIIGAGAAAPFTGTSLGNGGNCSGITFTTPVTRYWVGNGGNWSDTAHWSTSTGGASGASVPLLHDTVVFDGNSISSASQTIVGDVDRYPALDFTNVTNSPTYSDNSTRNSFFGSVKFIAGMSVSLGGWFNMFGYTNQTFTSAGKQINEIDIYMAPGIKFTLQDNLSVYWLYHNQGEFDLNDKNVTTYDFESYSSGYSPETTLDLRSGTITIHRSSTSSCYWYIDGDVVLNAGTSTIEFGGQSGRSGYFSDYAASRTYYNVKFVSNYYGSYNDFEKTGTPTFTFNNLEFGPGTYLYVYNNITFIVNSLISSATAAAPSMLDTYNMTLTKASGTDNLDNIIIYGVNASGNGRFVMGPSTGDRHNSTGFIWDTNPASANKRQVLIAGAFADTSGGDANTLLGGQEGNPGWTSTTVGRQVIIPVAGIVKQVQLLLEAAPTGGTYRWQIDAYDESNNTRWSRYNDEGYTASTTPTFSGIDMPVFAGWKIRIKRTSSGSPTAVVLKWTTEVIFFSNRFILGDGSFTLFGNDNTRRYAGPFSGQWFDTTLQTIYKAPVPIACTLREVFANYSASPGTGKSYIFSVYKNGSEEATTILTVSDSNTHGGLTGLSVAFAAGDTLAISFISSGSPGSNPWGDWTLSFEPTSNIAESFYGATSTNGMPTGSNAYAPLPSSEHTWNATENNMKRYWRFLATKIDRLRVILSGSPGVGKSYAITLRKSGNSTSLSASVADANTTANDLSNSAQIAAGDYIDILTAPSGTPTSRQAAISMALLTANPTYKQFTMDAYIAERTTKTYTADALMRDTFTKTFTVDAVVLRTYLATFFTDGIIKVLGSEQTFTIDAFIADLYSGQFTADGIIVPAYYFLGNTWLPRPTTLERENVYIKKDVLSISGKSGADLTNMKEKIVIGWNRMKKNQFDALYEQIQRNVPLDFLINDGNLQIPATSVLATIKTAQYGILGSDYLVSTEVELTEVT